MGTTLVAIIMILMVVIIMVLMVDITPKEVKVVLVTIPKEVKEAVVTIPREVSFNGKILPCVSDRATEYRVESILVVIVLLVLILMFMQKMVQEVREILISSWEKLHESKDFYLYQTEILFIKKTSWCLWTAS